MLEALKKEVFECNMALQASRLVTLTFGNVSGIDRNTGLVVIKPSGVAYDGMTVDDMVVVDLDGRVIEGKYRPSSDTPTHLVLYRAYPSVGGIIHTHSHFATVFAQCGRGIPPLGTTHADTFYGEIPCTRPLKRFEIRGDYEAETGKVITEAIAAERADAVPAALVYSHGPFTWGKSPTKALEHAIILEEVAGMAWHTLMMNPAATLARELADKHYFRKHGENAYYGQS